MRIAVVGAGWYGCHIARELLHSGSEIQVFDARDQIFQGASGYTQNRLHLGFHYPRSAETRSQTILGYKRFKETYPTLSSPIAHNLYAVADRDSLLDAETYRQIIEASKLPFDRAVAADYGLYGASNVFRVPEELLCTRNARQMFRESLSGVLRLATPVCHLDNRSDGAYIDGERFDAALDCTWGALNSSVWSDLYFESCVTLVYESLQDESIALTIVDGPFFSIYPYEGRLFTVNTVTHTPLGQHGSYAEARVAVNRYDEREVRSIRREMELQILKFLPSFLERFAFVNCLFSIKAKILSGSDARVAAVRRVGRVVYVFSGKVDAIFFAADQVREKLCEFL